MIEEVDQERSQFQKDALLNEYLMKSLQKIYFLVFIIVLQTACSTILAQQNESARIHSGLNIQIVVKVSFEGIQSEDLWLIENVFHKKLKKSHIIISIETNSTYLKLQIDPGSSNLSNGNFEIDTDYKLTRNINANGGKNELNDIIQENFSLRKVDWRLNVRLWASSNCPIGIYADVLHISITDQTGQIYNKDLDIQADLIGSHSGRTPEDSLKKRK